MDDLGNARLTDFGLTTVYQNSGTLSVMTSARGTLRWMAPEMLSGDASQPTVETDMYALGMTIWQVLLSESFVLVNAMLNFSSAIFQMHPL